MKMLLSSLCSYFLFGAISTPVTVVDLDNGSDISTISSTSATPSEYALIIKICYTLDNSLSAHNVPTDSWANTPAWTEIEDNPNGFSVCSLAWTTTAASPGAGQVTQGFTEASAEVGLAIIEITNVQLRNPIVGSNSGGGTSATLSITVSGTLGPNDVMVSGIGSRQDADGVTATGNNNEIDDELTGGSLSSSHQVQRNNTDLVASWGDINGSVVNASGVAVHIRGLNNIMLLGSLKPKLRILFYKGLGD